MGFGVKLSSEDIVEIERLRDIAMATSFGTTLCKWPRTRDNDMGISYKGWLVFSQPLCLLVALSGFVVAAVGTAAGGQLSGWELTR